MGEREGIYIPSGRKVYLENGVEAVSHRRKKQEKRKKPGNTAIHEAKHAGVAEKKKTGAVKRVSITPGPGYLGITEMNVMIAAAAAAPDADHMSGTGHDVRVIEMMGVSLSTARSEAKNIMAQSEDEIEEIAYQLEEKKDMSGGEVRQAMLDAKNRYEEVIFFRSPDGVEREIVRAVHEPRIIPHEIVSFVKAR